MRLVLGVMLGVLVVGFGLHLMMLVDAVRLHRKGVRRPLPRRTTRR